MGKLRYDKTMAFEMKCLSRECLPSKNCVRCWGGGKRGNQNPGSHKKREHTNGVGQYVELSLNGYPEAFYIWISLSKLARKIFKGTFMLINLYP